MPGTHIASIMDVLRRITALLAMIALIGLLLLLIWQVELHHERGSASDEPAVVTLVYLAA
jgi:TRAP-type C4-dicarboxylate transport system permease small subunit